jgi:hypothetical protein
MFLGPGITWAQLVSDQKISKEIFATNPEEVKKILLFDAVLASLKHFAPELGFNFDDYQKQLENKFLSHFENVKHQKMLQTFGKNYQGSMTAPEREAFTKKIEMTKTEEFRKFSHLYNVVLTYDFKSLTQSPENPTLWISEIHLSLDKALSERIIKKILSHDVKAFSKLILLTEITSHGFSWKDLGLEKADSFSDALNISWEKWFNENLPTQVEEVTICPPECQGVLREWERKTQSDITLVIDQHYQNSVIARLSFDLKRLSVQENLQQNSYEWMGRINLIEFNTKRILASFDLASEKAVISGTDHKILNSQLASAIYRTPLNAFAQFDKKLSQKKGINRVIRLVIQGQHHIGDVLAVMELLKARGSSLGLDPKLDFFQQNEAQLLCFYQGEEKSFSDLLSSLKELKSSHSYVLVNEFTGINHVLKLVNE